VTLASLNELDEAGGAIRQALDLGQSQIKRGNGVGCIILASAADVERKRGHWVEAEATAQRAFDLFEKFSKSAENPLLAYYLNALAEPTRLLGKLEEAETICIRAQQMLEKSFGPEHYGLDPCLATLARIRMAQCRYGEAQQLFDRCVAILEKNVIPDHPELILRLSEAAPAAIVSEC
jgi:hypothetical protein